MCRIFYDQMKERKRKADRERRDGKVEQPERNVQLLDHWIEISSKRPKPGIRPFSPRPLSVRAIAGKMAITKARAKRTMARQLRESKDGSCD